MTSLQLIVRHVNAFVAISIIIFLAFVLHQSEIAAAELSGLNLKPATLINIEKNHKAINKRLSSLRPHPIAEGFIVDEALYLAVSQIHPPSILLNGLEKLQEGDYEATIQQIDKALSIDSSYPDAYLIRGYAYVMLENYQAAIRDFSSAINISPGYYLAYYWRGIVYSWLGEFGKSKEDLSKSLSIKPKQADPYYFRGLIEVELEEYQDAISDFNQAINADKNYIPAYLHRGIIEANQSNYLTAISDFSEAIRIDQIERRFLDELFVIRAICYGALGDYQMSVEDLTKAVNLNDTLAEAYVFRGFYRTRLKLYDDAIEDYQISARLFQEQDDLIRHSQSLNRIAVVRELMNQKS